MPTTALRSLRSLLGAIAYADYMNALSPATNWNRDAWRAPLACLFTFAAEIMSLIRNRRSA